MASCSPFTMPFSGDAESLLKKVKSMVGKYNGSFSGDVTKGEISVSVPVVGKLDGGYHISGNECTINITKRPIYIPCGQIQAYFKEVIS